jgi:hypothetical protein
LCQTRCNMFIATFAVPEMIVAYSSPSIFTLWLYIWSSHSPKETSRKTKGQENKKVAKERHSSSWHKPDLYQVSLAAQYNVSFSHTAGPSKLAVPCLDVLVAGGLTLLTFKFTFTLPATIQPVLSAVWWTLCWSRRTHIQSWCPLTRVGMSSQLVSMKLSLRLHCRYLN